MFGKEVVEEEEDDDDDEVIVHEGQSGGSMKTTGKERNIINYHIFNFIILCFFMTNIDMSMILFSHIFMMLNVIFNKNRNILYYMLP